MYFINASTDIDFETFLMLKPNHIQEAIPSLGQRIRFENLYEKFLSGLDEVIVLEKANDKNPVLLEAMNDYQDCSIGNILNIDTLPSPKKSEVTVVSKEITHLRTAEVFSSVVSFVINF